MNAFTGHLSNFEGRRSLAKCRLSRVHGQMLTVVRRLSKVCDQTSGVPCNRRKSSEISDDLRMFGTIVAFSRRHSTKILATVDIDNCRQRIYGNMAQVAPFWRCLLNVHAEQHIDASISFPFIAPGLGPLRGSRSLSFLGQHS